MHNLGLSAAFLLFFVGERIRKSSSGSGLSSRFLSFPESALTLALLLSLPLWLALFAWSRLLEPSASLAELVLALLFMVAAISARILFCASGFELTPLWLLLFPVRFKSAIALINFERSKIFAGEKLTPFEALTGVFGSEIC